MGSAAVSERHTSLQRQQCSSVVVLPQLPREVVERRCMPVCHQQNNDDAADTGQNFIKLLSVGDEDLRAQ